MQKQILALVLCLLQCLLVSVLHGRNYYIASNGSDSNNGYYPANGSGGNGPWKTIDKVNGMSFKPGDSVLFRRGDSWSNVAMKANDTGNAGAYVVYGAYGSGEKPTLLNQGINIDGSYLVIENFIVKNSAKNGVERLGGQHFVIRNCDIYAANQNGIRIKGINFTGFEDVLIEGCYVEGSGVDNITCHKGANGADNGYGIVIRNNVAVGAGEEGFDITTGSQFLIEGNSTYNNTHGSIFIGYDVHHVLVRKHFGYNEKDALKFRKTHDTRVEYSVFIGDKDLIKFSENPGLGSATGVEVYNCVFWQTGTARMMWAEFSSGPIKFRNNIFGSATSSPVFKMINSEKIGPGGNYSFDYNFYYKPNVNNSTPFFSIGTKTYSVQDLKSQLSAEINGLLGNPELINGTAGLSEITDFLISPGSPLINRGLNVGATADFFDTPIAGNEIPDIGITEFSTVTGFPVEWLSFDATPDYLLKKVNLKWATARETNNGGFQVQRSSDLVVFEDLLSVSAVGNSNNTTDYTAEDLYPVKGEMYYRIKQTDLDGTFSFSSVVKVNFDPVKNEQMSVFPTKLPPGDAVTLTLPLPVDGINTVGIQLMDIHGRRFDLKTLKTENTRVKYQLPYSLPQGYYVLTVTVGDQQRGFRILVRRD